MSKADFFINLKDRLRGLPNEEKQHIIRIYEDLFRQAEESGRSEREIIESLGFVPLPAIPPVSPPRIGEHFTQRDETGIRVVIAAIALGLFNLILVLGPFIGITAVLFSLTLVSMLFISSSIWIILGTGIPDELTVLMLEIFSALALTGLGVLIGIALWKVNIGYLKLVKRYAKLNMKLIKGD